MPKTKNLPVLPLRDIVVFPDMVAPLFVGRDKSVRALEMIEEADNEIMLVAQLDAAIDDPGSDDVHETGTIATILQLLKLPDGTVKVLVEGTASSGRWRRPSASIISTSR
jgi:ATP-dependent Lon protease